MEMVQKSGMYDDGLPIIRWRFPLKPARWFGMTRSDGPPNFNLQSWLHKGARMDAVVRRHAGLSENHTGLGADGKLCTLQGGLRHADDFAERFTGKTRFA